MDRANWLVIIAVSLLIAAGWFGHAAAASTAVVNAGVLNVRSGPGTTNELIDQVREGDKLPVIESAGDWYKIKLNSDSNGWVAGEYVQIKDNDTLTGMIAVITADVLNVHSTSKITADVVSQVKEGERLSVVDSSGDWYKVKLENGSTGWIAGWYAEIKHNSSQQDEQPASTSQHEAEKMQAVVTADVLNVRSSPGQAGDIINQVKEGENFPVISSSNGWCKIELSDGSTGWIAGWYVEYKKQQSSRSFDKAGLMQGVVNAWDVNVRGGPGKDHPVITRVDRGECMGVIEQAGDWCKVRLAEGAIGWIADWLINIDTASATTPLQEEQLQNGSSQANSSIDDEKWLNSDGALAKLEVREVNDRTVVKVTATGAMGHEIFTLSDPNRVVADLKGVKPGDLPSKIDVSGKLVKEIRTSKYSEDPDVVRLVFDIKEPVMFTASKSKDEQLTMEIYTPELGKHVKNKVIVIDPGHGGKDPGAEGPTGLKEKTVNMDVSLLAAHLLRQSGARVVLTRSSDTYVGLERRTEIADSVNADIFVSIHMNAHPKSFKAGTSTYYRRDDISGLGVSQEDNRVLTQQLQAQLLQSLGRRNIGMKQANFVVLRTAKMPSALVEASFISNPEEEDLLKQDSYRAQIAEAAARGIAGYFASRES